MGEPPDFGLGCEKLRTEREALVVHRNARLTPAGRRILVERIEVEGWPVAVAAESMGVSRETAYRWLRRYRAEEVAGLEDRSSRPHRSPNQTLVEIEDRICVLRRSRRWGPHRIAYALEMSRSTVERVLRRRGLSRLDAIDRPTRRIVRRYEKATPGELVHVDVEKLGRIPDGGGWKVHGRAVARGSRTGGGSQIDGCAPLETPMPSEKFRPESPMARLDGHPALSPPFPAGSRFLRHRQTEDRKAQGQSAR